MTAARHGHALQESLWPQRHDDGQETGP